MSEKFDGFDWTDIPELPEPVDPHREAAKKYRHQGLVAVFKESDFIGPQTLPILYYKCRRGCGGLVWDPEAHMKNVCTEFNPIAGN